MADEPVTKPSGASRFLWLFVILALVLLWWYFRPQSQPDMTPADADAMAQTDPDDILVDLKDLQADLRHLPSRLGDGGDQFAALAIQSRAFTLERAQAGQLHQVLLIEIANPD